MVGVPPSIATLRAGQEITGVFACTRKDRLTARTGSPYLAVELRDKTGSVPARAFRDADVLAGRFDRGDVVRVRGRVETFRDELQVELADIARATPGEAEPETFLPVAYRDLDELDGFLEHLAREVHDPQYARLLGALVADDALRADWRRAPCTRDGHHAYLGGLLEHTVAVAQLAAETCLLHVAAEQRPAHHRRARPRPRQDARVHLRRGHRADRGGAAARPRRARPRPAAHARRRPARRRAPARAVALRAHPPRPGPGARAALRLARGRRAVPPQRARRERQGRPRARPELAGLPHASPLVDRGSTFLRDRSPAVVVAPSRQCDTRVSLAVCRYRRWDIPVS